MSKTITLKNEIGGIHITFGYDVSMHIHPINPELKRISREMYLYMQKHYNHNRNAMCADTNWRKIIDITKEKYGMTEEETLWQET